MHDLQQRIEELVASNPGQMDASEYGAIADELLMRGPCSFLVFGLGKDTRLWMDVNRNGRTVFLEHDERWMRRMVGVGEPWNFHLVEYTTKVSDAEELKRRDGCPMILPVGVREMKWDVVLVDAPPGDGPERPGRFQSIYEASRLAAPDGCVFVHDVHRPIESWFSRRYLGQSIERIQNLGVFGTKAKPPRR